jgi:DNA-binding protein HU-beta
LLRSCRGIEELLMGTRWVLRESARHGQFGVSHWTSREEFMPAAKKAAAVPKKAASAKAGAAGTVTLKQIAAELAEGHELPKRQAEAVLGDLVEVTARHLKKGDKVRITGLGILQVRKRAARMGRNPATGEAIKIKASKKIAFRPAKELKESV